MAGLTDVVCHPVCIVLAATLTVACGSTNDEPEASTGGSSQGGTTTTSGGGEGGTGGAGTGGQSGGAGGAGGAGLAPTANEWSLTFGDTQADRLQGLAVDPAGPVWVGGFFEGTTNFNGPPLTAAGATDGFIARLDAQGGHLFSKTIGDELHQLVWTVALASGGAVIVMGSCAYNFNGPLPPDVCDTQHDSYLAEFAASGAMTWASMMDIYMPRQLAIDPSGNIIVAYETSGDTVYVRKHDASGNQLWEQSFPPDSSNTHVVSGLECDSGGNILFTSRVVGGVLTKLDPAGNVVDQSTPVSAWGPFLAVDGSDNVIVAGGANIARLDADGNLLHELDLGQGFSTMRLAADGAGNVIVGGAIDGPVSLGNVQLGPTDAEDLLVLRLSPSLAYLASRLIPDQVEYHRIYDMEATADGGVIIGGAFEGTIDFGQGAATAVGYMDGFVARVEPEPE